MTSPSAPSSSQLPFRLSFAWQDLISSVRRVWLFCICILLGVALVMASASLQQMLNRSILADMRALMGGDVEIESTQALEQPVLDWIQSRGDLSLTRELNTMIHTADDDFLLVELLSTDQAYPLYGELELSTGETLQQATQLLNDQWGVAIDPVLAERLSLSVGSEISIGQLRVEVRALVLEQPDRRLNASWRGAPVLISSEAIDASGLIHPASRIEYEYRVRTEESASAWKQAFYAQFPDTEWEVQTFEDRSERIAERLAQVASGLLIVAFSTLFIGGLGVFNSVTIYLSGKRETIATLKAIGLRPSAITQIYLLQILILASFSALAGVLFGSGLASLAAQLIAEDIPLGLGASDLLSSGLVAWLFGLLTALSFSMPALGRAMSQGVSSLFRDEVGDQAHLSTTWRVAIGVFGAALVALVTVVIPSPLFGMAFVVAVGLCLLFFEGLVSLLKSLAIWLETKPSVYRHTALRFALANLHQPGTPLRMTLLSMGSAATLLVASGVVIFALLRLILTTIPEQSPALILYEVFADQKGTVLEQIQSYESTQDTTLAPLVRGRVTAINDVAIRDYPFEDSDQQEMARDEHKLSYLSGNIDGIKLVAGAFWEPSQVDPMLQDHQVDFLFAMEDREAEQMNLKPGDSVSWQWGSKEKTGLLTGIYSQQGVQTRFWFEAVLSKGVMDDQINRYVGTVFMGDAQAQDLQRELARSHPNIITLRTEDLVNSASDILSKATQGLVAVSSVSVVVSMLVLASVLSAGRGRQIYQATIMRAMGARLSTIKSAIQFEYLLLGSVVSLFSFSFGGVIAYLILQQRMKITDLDVYGLGLLIAIIVSLTVFCIGANYLFRKLALRPAHLLRERF